MRVFVLIKIIWLGLLLMLASCGGGGKSSTPTIDATAPVINVNGDNPARIAQYTNYTDAGATANDNRDGSVNVTSSGSVDSSAVGEYTISYTASDSAGNSTTKTRTVNVTLAPVVETPDTTPPVITVSGDNPVSIVQGSSYTDAGATATDDKDGSVNVSSSGSVDTASVGTYIITYTASDSAGNSTTKTRTVNVTLAPVVETPDTTPPVITVSGDNPVSIVQGSSYTDAGATAFDDKDGTVEVSSSGSVDVSTVGTYTITYTATDNAGNEASETRTVNVNAPPSAQKITISGQTAHQTINNGLVIVVDKSGTELGRTRTKADGSFSVEVAENKIASGYGLTVTEGKVGEVDFVGSMKSFYSAPHANDKANITVMTTLIDKVAENTGSYETAIQKLSNIGMTQSTDWFEVDQKKVEEDFLGFKVQQEESLDQWIEKIATDIADDDLSAVNMIGIFPQAHGGILSVNVPAVSDDGQLYFLKGYEEEVLVQSNVVDQNIDISYEIVTPVSSVDINTATGVLNIADSYNTGKTTVIVKAKTTNGSRDIKLNFLPLTPITLFDKTTSGGEELMVDDNDLFRIHINEPNPIPVGTKLKIVGARKDNGLWIINPTTEPEVDTSSIEVSFPSDEELNSIFNSNTLFLKTIKSIRKPLNKPVYTKNDCPSFPSYHTWNPFLARFQGQYRIPEQNQYSPLRGKIASILCGEELNTTKGKIPVLFIHGFTPLSDGVFGKQLDGYTGLGGGDGTWGNFLGHASVWEFNGEKTAVFEFRWKTNARFQDVAHDLQVSINKIANITGNSVHIIAHSFGGVLSRTYLQGITYRGHYADNSVPVASLTTIGTPHSGLATDGGYDQDLLALNASLFCEQISCFQMGDLTFVNLYANTLYFNNIRRGEITQKLNTNPFKLRQKDKSKIPIQVLIGIKNRGIESLLSDTGDGLISIDGQRFSSSDRYNIKTKSYRPPLRSSSPVTINNSKVNEYLLTNEKKNGFSHLSLFNGKLNPFNASNIAEVAVKDYMPQKINNCNYRLPKNIHPSLLRSCNHIANNIQLNIKSFSYKYSIKVKSTDGTKINDYSISIQKGRTVLTRSGSNFSIPFSDEFYLHVIPNNGNKYEKSRKIFINYVGRENPDNVDGNKVLELEDIVLEVKSSKTSDIKIESVSLVSNPQLYTQLSLKGSGFKSNTKVWAIRNINDDRQEATIDNFESNKLLITFDKVAGGLGAGQWVICAKNIGFDKICKTWDREIEQEQTIVLNSFTPSILVASKFGQKIIISGTGFEPNMKVYWKTNNNSNFFSSSTYINESTMSFHIRTGLKTQNWKIWVKGNGKQSNKIILPVNLPDVSEKPEAIQLVSPGLEGGQYEEIKTLTPVLKWNTSNGAKHYQVYLSDTTNGTTTFLNKRVDAPSTTLPLTTPLNKGQQYSWRVKAFNDIGESDYSTRFYFKTNNESQSTTPAKPKLKSPGTLTEPGPELTETTQALEWKATENTLYYNVAVRDIDTGLLVLNEPKVNGTTVDVEGLTPGHNFYWDITACNENDECSAWADSLYFQIKKVGAEKPDTPVISTSQDIKSDSITIGWNSIEGAVEYQLELIDEEGSDNQSLKIGSDKNSAKFENLKPEHRYQVKVRAKNSEAEGDYSEPLLFKTAKKPVIPLDKAIAYIPGSENSPGAEITDKNLNLSLKKITRATHYWVRVDDVTAGSIFYENKNLEFTSFPTQKTLSVDHDYKWKVAACNADGCGEWSDILYFKVVDESQSLPIPSKPRNLQPGSSERDNSVNLDSKNVTLQWSSENNASKYKLSLFDYNTTRYLVENQYITGTSYDASNLVDFGHQYFWDLRACNNNNECSSKERAHFNINGQVIEPDKPTGLSPGTTSRDNPQMLSDTSPTLRWSNANNADWYKVWVIKGNLSSSGVIVSRGVRANSNSYTVDGLLEGSRYWWYVEACNNDACIDSDYYAIEIEAAQMPVPSPPVITDTYILPTGISLAWGSLPGVDKYELELTDLEGNDNQNKVVTNTSGGFTNLSSDHRYKIGVRAHNSSGYGGYSYFEFKTKVAVPNAPDLIIVQTKGNNAFVAWNDITGADQYRVRLYDEDSSFSDSKYVDESPVAFLGLTPSHRYKVKIKARVNGVYSEYSDYEYFTIDNIVALCPLRHFTNNQISEYLQKGFSDLQSGVSQVAELQNFLNELGYNAGTADGIFGNGTEQAVKSYQSAKGLFADGKVGADTRDKINSTSCN